MLEFKVNEATEKPAPSGATGGNVSFKGRDLEKDGFAGIEFDGIEIERIYPNGKHWAVRQKLVPGVKYENGTPQIDDPKAELMRRFGLTDEQYLRNVVDSLFRAKPTTNTN